MLVALPLTSSICYWYYFVQVIIISHLDDVNVLLPILHSQFYACPSKLCTQLRYKSEILNTCQFMLFLSSNLSKCRQIRDTVLRITCNAHYLFDLISYKCCPSLTSFYVSRSFFASWQPWMLFIPEFLIFYLCSLFHMTGMLSLQTLSSFY